MLKGGDFHLHFDLNRFRYYTYTWADAGKCVSMKSRSIWAKQSGKQEEEALKLVLSMDIYWRSYLNNWKGCLYIQYKAPIQTERDLPVFYPPFQRAFRQIRAVSSLLHKPFFWGGSLAVYMYNTKAPGPSCFDGRANIRCTRQHSSSSPPAQN